MNRFLSQAVAIVRVKAYSAANTTTITSSTIDMQSYNADGVLFLTSFETAAADNILSVQHSDDDSSYAAVTGGAVAPGASDEAQFVDIRSPSKRYLQAVAARGTSTVLGNIWAIVYRNRTEPVDNTTAGTIAGVAIQGP